MMAPALNRLAAAAGLTALLLAAAFAPASAGVKDEPKKADPKPADPKPADPKPDKGLNVWPRPTVIADGSGGPGCELVRCASDGNPCTIDYCLAGVCHHDPIICDDLDDCTEDKCVDGKCMFIPRLCSNCTESKCTKKCNDYNPCTKDYCVNGVCIYEPMVCDDKNKCTKDRCNPLTGQCEFLPKCFDNNPCTKDLCIKGQCFYIPIDCNDGNMCTKDKCVNGQCIHIHKKCFDGNVCTKDWCDPKTGLCDFSTTVNCDDKDACTVDWCDPKLGCQHRPKDCNDNLDCTEDLCVEGNCTHTVVSCVTVDPTSGAGSPCTCNDNDPCTIDTCVDGACVFTPRCVSDNDTCTVDTCVVGPNGQFMGCESVPMDCQDGDPCTEDICRMGNCLNPPVVCDDFKPCTKDYCDPIKGGCLHETVLCGAIVNDDGTITEGCPCDDHDPCTVDTCVQGECVYTPYNCTDDNLCTLDFCDPVDGKPMCFHAPKPCEDDNSCTEDMCDPTTGACVHDLLNCDDKDKCTRDWCEDGICIHKAIVCNDNNNCTEDFCRPDVGCVFKPKCNDGWACTEDICNPLTGTCNYVSNCPPSLKPCWENVCHHGHCVAIEKKCIDKDKNPCTYAVCDDASGDCVMKRHCTEPCQDCRPRADGGFDCVEKICPPPAKCHYSDGCVNGTCMYTPYCNSAECRCNDNNACTEDKCVNGVCIFTPKCPKPGPCMVGGCDPKTGLCYEKSKNCDDGNKCTKDACDLATGLCFSVSLSDQCDDKLDCTTDYCDPRADGDGCVHIPDHTLCDDGNACTIDRCDGSQVPGTTATGCSHIKLTMTPAPNGCPDPDKKCVVPVCREGQCMELPLKCDDNNPCTLDTCNTTTAACEHKFICDETELDPCKHTYLRDGSSVCDDRQSCTDDKCMWDSPKKPNGTGEVTCEHTPLPPGTCPQRRLYERKRF